MGQHSRRESDPGPFASTISYQQQYPQHHSQRRDLFDNNNDLDWPFGKLECLNDDDIREAAYEIFFTACRSSPGFGGRNALTFYSKDEKGDEGSKQSQVAMNQSSKVKRALGLKMLKVSSSRRMTSIESSEALASPVGLRRQGQGGAGGMTMPPTRPKRPLTSAEIMRRQMRVTEQSDNRLRKTLMRTLVGQTGRRAESIVLPLELLRNIKPSEFNDTEEYHVWQKRQLKVLEVGLLMYPSIPIEQSNPLITRLKEIIQSGESKPLDTSKTSDTMIALCNAVVSLACRTPSGAAGDVFHWADGFPVNIHLYISLLQSIFDQRDETLVLDEIDELLDLMKKTWPTLGISKPIHDVCITWVFFQRYIVTGQVESDLLGASHAILTELANDAKKEKDSFFVKILSSMLGSMLGWVEKRLLGYHEFFVKGTVGQIENLLPLVKIASDILGEYRPIADDQLDSSHHRVDRYIRSSLTNAFGKIKEAAFAKSDESEEMTRVLLELAQEAEDLAMKDRQNYSPVLKKWHTTAGAVAALTLHGCYGQVLNQFLEETALLNADTVEVLRRADRLEKVLVGMVVEDSADCEDGGATLVREMVPYEVDTIILDLVKKWMEDAFKNCKELIQRAKEIETWNPKSKQEPYAISAVELMKLANAIVEEFFKIPVEITEDLVGELTSVLENLFREYMTFVAACGSKKSYIPSLPPLTRCNRNSKFCKMWKITSPCSYGLEEHAHHLHGVTYAHNAHPSTSRGTQRLYIRLNTLHFLLSHILALDKSILLSHPPNRHRLAAPAPAPAYFEIIASSILSACQHVSEIAAYRLIFLDSNSVFYDTLYTGDMATASIHPTLKTLQQNLSLMITILTDKAHAVAMKEVMKASFDAFLMVLLAGGSNRVYHRSHHPQIKDDFEGLKRLFISGGAGEGLVGEDEVEEEAEVVEGIIGLMAESTEQLMEDFSAVSCETSGFGSIGNGHKLPMPPTTRRWHSSDPNTILRVLCHRNDKTANQFLKRTFQLARRR